MVKNENWVNLGVVMKSDKGKFFISMGDTRQNNQYSYTVELTVKDNTGAVVAQATNPLINLQDPRANVDADKAARIPEKIKFRLSLPPARE